VVVAEAGERTGTIGQDTQLAGIAFDAVARRRGGVAGGDNRQCSRDGKSAGAWSPGPVPAERNRSVTLTLSPSSRNRFTLRIFTS
jgi:hypothetical protein